MPTRLATNAACSCIVSSQTTAEKGKGGLESLLYLSCSAASIAAVVNYRLWYASDVIIVHLYCVYTDNHPPRGAISNRTTDRKARVRLQKVM